jgi:holo-[acyl-carrier protein] synthase
VTVRSYANWTIAVNRGNAVIYVVIYYNGLLGNNELGILGIGTDLVEVRRIAEACKRQRFVERVFTPAELELAEAGTGRWQRLAGRFAAKEAVGKAFGRPLPWKSVEILSDDLGKPIVVLSGIAAELADGAKVHVSISHVRDYASAVAVMGK